MHAAVPPISNFLKHRNLFSNRPEVADVVETGQTSSLHSLGSGVFGPDRSGCTAVTEALPFFRCCKKTYTSVPVLRAKKLSGSS